MPFFVTTFTRLDVLSFVQSSFLPERERFTLAAQNDYHLAKGLKWNKNEIGTSFEEKLNSILSRSDNLHLFCVV